MKKIKVVLVALIFGGLALTSCGGDDDNNTPSTPATLFGKWTPTKEVVKVGTQPDVTTPYDDNEPGCDKDYVQFLETGSVFKDQYFFKNGSNVCTEDGEDPGTFTKAADNTSLTINSTSDLNGTYTMTLSNTQLTLSFNVQAGANTVKTTYFFTKIN